MKESVVFKKRHDGGKTLTIYALALGLALAVPLLARVLSTEAI
jgi:hypothetical protein